MALKKTISGRWEHYKEEIMKEDGSLSHVENRSKWIEQQDLDMHPLEEQMTLAFWKMNDLTRDISGEPSLNEEPDWMLEFGIDYVKKKRQELKDAHDLVVPQFEQLKKEHLSCQEQWNTHVEKCVVSGLCPDTYFGDDYIKIDNIKVDENGN